jgi:hypothetical protein
MWRTGRHSGWRGSQAAKEPRNQLRAPQHDDRNEERPVYVSDQYAAPPAPGLLLRTAVGLHLSSVGHRKSVFGISSSGQRVARDAVPNT